MIAFHQKTARKKPKKKQKNKKTVFRSAPPHAVASTVAASKCYVQTAADVQGQKALQKHMDRIISI
jgi:hypothetical protein